MKAKHFRSDEEWSRLFTVHSQSGQSAASFCKDKGLCPKHFSLRRKQLGYVSDPKRSGFVAVKTKPPLGVLSESCGGVKIRYVEIKLSSTRELEDALAALLR